MRTRFVCIQTNLQNANVTLRHFKVCSARMTPDGGLLSLGLLVGVEADLGAVRDRIQRRDLADMRSAITVVSRCTTAHKELIVRFDATYLK